MSVFYHAQTLIRHPNSGLYAGTSESVMAGPIVAIISIDVIAAGMLISGPRSSRATSEG